MNIHSRRFLAGFFILIFIIIAPLLILYTAGYRYSIKKQRLTSAGSLVIETEPRDATVYLSNHDKSYKTPARINDLTSNDYQITITKDGYYNWNKTLKIESQQTTFAENIILFSKASATPILQNISGNIYPDHQHQNIIFTQDSTLKIYNIETNKILTIKQLEDNQIVQDINWSINNNYFLIQLHDNDIIQHIVANKNNPTNTITIENYLQDIKNPVVKFNRTNDDRLLILNQNNLYGAKINLSSLEISTFYSFPKDLLISDYLVYKDQIFFLEKTSDKQYLKKIVPTNKNNDKNNRIQLSSSEYQLIDFIDNKIFLKDFTKNTTFIINSGLDNVLFEQNDLIQYDFNAKSKKLAMTTPSEINVVDFNNYPFNVITVIRVSNGLQKTFWYFDPNYLIFQENNQLKTIELDERDQRHIITLSPENTSDFFLDSTGKFLSLLTSNSTFEKLILIQ
ncbi:hypothetical protein A2533_03370 [Candidatus Falkowbacteria bacterium RIFOXYD2_FULL_35_9]|uniref:PEGA domain-containing protein n=1 Tax=Candidatus Falkowbacteria bacterium RIFOXYC2_FULL_36_12 TaxID=1798002 RepID=A0A1F5SW20_9BACT|nr:MAG: hypothetical protein A2478_00550 [Candidatus Falkowbacteria bacterium RIFOXYC2_FULL_36_12]OGF31213.1 MAG: hypothetical protein A2300_04065 [Candidatus Falkowbacteria bacterium RIFOXYB2_FULL_35_7]OGF47042.1 MAG: hypothetical protein A2533_03370 [Candidatus Falkowbacteria bacterium RIFOXYD2_FULL_35_9]